ncbi:MAG TPA: LysM peptidoglycan-binding domain-containing protein [Treponemataceae bacterium]|nr:LysM peptidoglycan-binding domain-containing protein [Treponemataceae bacterium]HPS44425.1 LysM peptidoglycan-binding domain-containing protein [Treponemataceae bacterium]
MATASIGIKLADSKFFPILDEGVPASKILELTTVRDNQSSVQINLFRSETGTIDDASYVGTLIIEDVAPRKVGEPTIELTLTLDDLNELSAEAVDLESGTRQVLTVSLETLESESRYSLPDFDLTPIDTSVHLGDDPEHENLVIQGAIPGNAPEGLYEMHEDDERKGGIFMPAWLCILILVIGVAALVLALLVSARTMLAAKSAPAQAPVAEAPAVPAVQPVAEPTPEPAATTEPATPPPAETPAAETPTATVVEEPAAPVQPEPAPEAKETKLKLKWGDTLWDISEAYYKNPWLYPKIAKYNKIKNPNLIIAGTYINIPPK